MSISHVISIATSAVLAGAIALHTSTGPSSAPGNRDRSLAASGFAHTLSIPAGSLPLITYKTALHSDDYPDLQSAINDAIAQGYPLFVSPGQHLITSPLIISSTGLQLHGAGIANTTIYTYSNITSLIHIAGSSAEVSINNIKLSTIGTTSRCIQIDHPAQAIRLTNVDLSGSNTDALLHSMAAGFLVIQDCALHPDSSTCYGVVLDSYNQNCSIRSTRFGRSGNCVWVKNTVSGHRVEGLRITDVASVATGPFGLRIENSLHTVVSSSVIDQGTGYGIHISLGCDGLILSDCWIGMMSTATTAIPVFIDGSAGGSHAIDNNTIAGLSGSIIVGASATARVESLSIRGNRFIPLTTTGTTWNTVQLDSIGQCQFISNSDHTGPTNGTLSVLRTNTATSRYTLSANLLDAVHPIGYIDPASTYTIGGP